MKVDTIHNIDCLEGLRQMPNDYVDCVITSPPYWGLRDYGIDGQLGFEPTLDEYISKLTEIFHEVKRVLKPTGTLWLNMGDSYNSVPCHNGKSFRRDRAEIIPSKRIQRGSGRWGGGNNSSSSLKPKDLLGLPWQLAFALQADGWYLRSDIIWAKPNPMPESVTDRPTKAHEYLFLMSKEAKYYYDAEVIREESGNNTHSKGKKLDPPIDNAGIGHKEWHKYTSEILPYRNRRTVWTIATQPYSEAHFATFPEKLVEPCILAGTSEKGNCAECGKQWVRMVEKSYPPKREVNSEYPGKQTISTRKYKHGHDGPIIQTTGWQPSCSCGADIERPIVLDPFMGSGTVALVAARYNRHFIGFELNKEYCEMARKRIAAEMAQNKLEF